MLPEGRCLTTIDIVRSLPFSTDEFFAAIRASYNRRAKEPEFHRLTFCLLGVATPSDLIRDTRLTPFNIGRRIELNDFTEGEVAPLTKGFGKDCNAPERLLDRVLYWTAGHPYLTQRLCQAIANEGGVNAPADLDRLCKMLFFSSRAREQDDNLLFVRERILRSEVDLAGLLHLYEKVLRRKPVPDDETNPLLSVLRLSGIVRVLAGRLIERNRIYGRAFNPSWVQQNLPDAELRRQRAAFRRGVIRTAAVAVSIISAFALLAVYAFSQARRADRVAKEETYQRQRAEDVLRQMQIQSAQEFFAADNSPTAIAYLARVLRKDPTNRVAGERLISALTQRNVQMGTLW